MAVELDRTALLAHRARTQGLHGTASIGDLDVLTLGLQDAAAGSAAHALRQRTGAAPRLDRPELALVLTMRGSPHLHRRADLPLLRAALRPRDNDALRAFLGGYGDQLIASGADGPALLDQVATELRAVFPGDEATKGELSGAVTPRLPEIARPWCEGCGVAHVAEGLFRLGTLYAGIELVPHDGRRQRFRLASGEPAVAKGDKTTELLRTFLRLAGPATLGDLVMWLDTRSVTAPPAWLRPSFDELSGELVEVRVGGLTLWAHPDAVAGGAPDPPPLLLLPPRDAFALGNRAFLVPDRAVAKSVWRPVGSPGTVLVDGEIAGTWRARQSGRVLRLTVAMHRELTAKQRTGVEEQAEIVAAVRGHDGKTEVELD
ncbi:MAG: DNA glycosylase AlkZ-like family protein [Actinophytocola sp.]|uniref:DNA glycosylase AlkZ-like family protein n=1 Tax=Actinophytocola sp. TaxID=1872138 RepID=UPI003D6AB3B8